MKQTPKPTAPATHLPSANAAPAAPLIEFPCNFPIKVMGAKSDEFVTIMAAVVREHDPEFDHLSIEIRESSGGKYLGLTLSVTATSQEHLDNIYRALTGHPLAKYVL